MTADGIAAGWIAADWGSSNLRAWAMDGAGRVVAEAGSARGAATLAAEAFEPALLEVVGPWLAGAARTDVIVCGRGPSHRRPPSSRRARRPCRRR